MNDGTDISTVCVQEVVLLSISQVISIYSDYISITVHNRLRIGNRIFDKIKQDFFQAVAVSVLLYGCTMKPMEKS